MGMVAIVTLETDWQFLDPYRHCVRKSRAGHQKPSRLDLTPAALGCEEGVVVANRDGSRHIVSDVCTMRLSFGDATYDETKFKRLIWRWRLACVVLLVLVSFLLLENSLGLWKTENGSYGSSRTEALIPENFSYAGGVKMSGLYNGLEKYLTAYVAEERLRTGKNDVQCPMVHRFAFEPEFQAFCDNWDLTEDEFKAWEGVMHQRIRLQKFVEQCISQKDELCVLGPICLTGIHNFVHGLDEANPNYRPRQFVRMPWTELFDFDALGKQLEIPIVALGYNESVMDAVWNACGSTWEGNPPTLPEEKRNRLSKLLVAELSPSLSIKKAAAAAIDIMGGVDSFIGVHIRRGDKKYVDAFRCLDNFTQPERVAKIISLALADSPEETQPKISRVFIATNEVSGEYMVQLREALHPIEVFSGSTFLHLWSGLINLDNNYLLMELEWATLLGAKYTIRTYPDTFEEGEKVHDSLKFRALVPYQKKPGYFCPGAPDKRYLRFQKGRPLPRPDDAESYCQSMCELAQIPVDDLVNKWTPSEGANEMPKMIVWTKTS